MDQNILTMLESEENKLFLKYKNMTPITMNNIDNISTRDILKYEKIFSQKWIVSFPWFMDNDSIYQIQKESEALYPLAYKSTMWYNLFVDDDKVDNASKKRLSNIVFNTQKSCICYDYINENSLLKQLYLNTGFQAFISTIVWAWEIYPYADTLSSININYYNPWDALEWHFDNCEFTITLLIQKPELGGVYEYFPNKRYLENGNEDYESIEKMITWKSVPDILNIEQWDLILFRWTESLHRVTEITWGQRILVTFCYNSKPGISLSETSRMTFFWRTQ